MPKVVYQSPKQPEYVTDPTLSKIEYSEAIFHLKKFLKM